MTNADDQLVTGFVFGTLQPGRNWATVSGRVRIGATERAFTLIVDGADPLATGTPPTMILQIEGMAAVAGTVTGLTEIRER